MNTNTSSGNVSASGIEEKFNTFVDKVNEFVDRQKVPAWFKPFSELLKDFMNDITLTVNALEGKMAIQTAVTDALMVDRDQLVIKLENLLQYTRRNMLLIHGIDEAERENTNHIVLEVAGKVGIQLKEKQINRSHRLGPKRSNTARRPRPIIVSFIS